MYKPPKERWGCLQWAVVLVVGLLGWLSIESFRPMISKQAFQMRGVMNCKQIILSLKQYAVDNGSAYPDAGPAAGSAKSANRVFRRLFEERFATDERIFGCPNSVFVPDMDIGMAPDFAKALTPGECHWMLLKLQTDRSAADAPIVVENALNGSWPPKWDASGEAGGKRGRTWPGRKIIVGRNDGSVAVEKLSTDGTIDWRANRNLGNDNHDGKSWIDTLTAEQIAKLSYWDIEEK
jgi:hypothetical protein